jgi:hypothetical protein
MGNVEIKLNFGAAQIENAKNVFGLDGEPEQREIWFGEVIDGLAGRDARLWPGTRPSTATTCRHWSGSAAGRRRWMPGCSRRVRSGSAARSCRATG